MNKFTTLCEKVEKLLKEQENVDPNAVAPAAAPAPEAAPAAAPEETPPSDISTDSSSIHIATNDEIKKMILNLSNYLQDNLSESNALRKALKEVGTDIDNSDESIKKVIDIILNVVNPETENPDVPVPPAETGGESTLN